MADAMTRCLSEGSPRAALAKLPSVTTDVLIEHPQMAALFQQALQGSASPGASLMRAWLDRLLTQGLETAQRAAGRRVDRAELAIQVVAMFNLTTGYFLSQRVLDGLGAGDLMDPKNLSRQKAMLDRIGRAVRP